MPEALPSWTEASPSKVRTIFISDVHLGTKGAQPDLLLSFLDSYEADTIYLIGDIVDGWRLKKTWHWPARHNDVIQAILRRANEGTRIVYLPGNHDEFLRDYPGVHFGGIELTERTIHVGVDGKKYLVLHGDQFDTVIMNAKWLAHIGDWAYASALWCNTVVNAVRRRLGLSYWSLSALAKSKVKTAVNFIGRFEDVLAQEAQRSKTDGIICGHIHSAADRMIEDVRYLNSGDWVESCTGLIEHENGEFEIVHWAEREKNMLPSRRAA